MVDLNIGFLSTLDTVDLTHQAGVIIIFLIFLLGLHVLTDIKLFSYKKAGSKIMAKKIAMLLILIGVLAAVILSGLIEMIAGVVIILAAIWLSNLSK